MNLSDIKKIVISDHALTGWLERVGPSIDVGDLNTFSSEKEMRFAMREVLAEKLSGYLKEPERVRLLREECFVFDEEIVGVYANESYGELKIVTFTGRISENPILNNLDRLHSFIRAQRQKEKLFYTNEGVKLDLSDATLARQKFPEFNPFTLIEVSNAKFKITKKAENKYQVQPLTKSSRGTQAVEFDTANIGRSVHAAHRRNGEIPINRWAQVSERLLAYHKELEQHNEAV